tara:strand:+ start:205 stop:669 length:465 start_codon:yes stop_codon:yes gene_type:complete
LGSELCPSDGNGVVTTIVANTDAQALAHADAHTRLLLGDGGAGAGGDAEAGRVAALESEAQIAEHLLGADIVFVTAGMGGGTGSGAAAVVARQARQAGALVVALVTVPFGFEGQRREEAAAAAVERLRDESDVLVQVQNDRWPLAPPHLIATHR